MFEDLINAAQELNRHISRVGGLTDVGALTLDQQEETLLEILQDQLVQLEEFATRQLGLAAKREYL
jgi:hypothetical protein